MESTDSPSSSEPADPPIRLGIAHLLLWTAGSALLLGVLRLGPRQFPEGMENLATALLLLESISYGAALASLALLLPWGNQEVKFPRTAGHGVLVLYGVVAVSSCVARGIYLLLCRVHEVERLSLTESDPYWIVRSIMAFVVAVLFVRLLRLGLPLPWKIFALLTGLVALLQGCMYLAICVDAFAAGRTFAGLANLLIWAKLIPLTWCLAHDLRDTNRYDALHWAGLAVGFMALLLHVCWRMSMWFG